ncbi:hypothetical protein IW140_004752 [Coemansia sp. RSA 1813]|nr:hypothetical protein EV178_004789 [Coemansia sp. RSA 1646]KAJ1768983.1 hypothetical protein LPJ74_004413 [Coemansia sp. RSA 1843]KAJ2087585.1 hypothetical protein IW138_004868 [Coemansia sp. RSA 986]KAJ2212533.1 hypothetical protein EV179_004585 [Coemansia sp. RSA 487]KAJ2566889.1 hypothetical protein IW140_004752 [Coemansia sp. RSA 1813]
MVQREDYTWFRAKAGEALARLLESAKQLEQQFQSTSPQEVLLPSGLSFGSQKATNEQHFGPHQQQQGNQQHYLPDLQEANSGSRDAGGWTRAITRPCYLHGIHRRLTEMLQHQKPISFDDISMVQCGVSITPQRTIVFRGCKGIGKSYLMFLAAAQLLVLDRSVRVVYIADCGDWRRCMGAAERSVFLAEAIAAAFADSIEVQEMVDMWIEQAHHDAVYRRPLFVSLLQSIDAYCQKNDLKIAMLLDCIDKVAGPEPESEEIVANLVFMQHRYQYAMILAASDDTKARVLSEKLNAGDMTISSPFSSVEASLFINSCGLGARLQAPQLKQILKLTWQHPAELQRLCILIQMQHRRLGNGGPDTAISLGIQEFSLKPFIDFVPKPFAAFLSQAQTLAGDFAQAAIDTLRMSSYIGGLIDTNYMVLAPMSHQHTFMYPSPQIAKGMVELHCKAPNDIYHSLEHYLIRMQMVLYQRFL